MLDDFRVFRVPGSPAAMVSVTPARRQLRGPRQTQTGPEPALEQAGKCPALFACPALPPWNILMYGSLGSKPNRRLRPTPVGEGSGGESHGPDPARAVPGSRLWLGQAPVLRTRPRGRLPTRHAARGLDAHGPADSADRRGCADLRSEQCGPDLQAWLHCRHQPLRFGVFWLRLQAAAKPVMSRKQRSDGVLEFWSIGAFSTPTLHHSSTP